MSLIEEQRVDDKEWLRNYMMHLSMFLGDVFEVYKIQKLGTNQLLYFREVASKIGLGEKDVDNTDTKEKT